MHIIIDFDYTLFDTEAMRSALIDVSARHGVTEDTYRETEMQVKKKGGTYNMQAHIALLLEDRSARERLAEEWEEALQGAESFLYEDARAFMLLYQEQEVTVLSFGSPEWQRKKIERSGITDLVDDVITTDGPKGDALQRLAVNEETVIITDRGSEIDEMYGIDQRPRYVLLRREGTPYAEEPCEHATRVWTDLAGSL